VTDLFVTRSPSPQRDDVAQHMAPDQIAEAQRMAREWMVKHQQ